MGCLSSVSDGKKTIKCGHPVWAPTRCIKANGKPLAEKIILSSSSIYDLPLLESSLRSIRKLKCVPSTFPELKYRSYLINCPVAWPSRVQQNVVEYDSSSRCWSSGAIIIFACMLILYSHLIRINCVGCVAGFYIWLQFELWSLTNLRDCHDSHS